MVLIGSFYITQKTMHVLVVITSLISPTGWTADYLLNLFLAVSHTNMPVMLKPHHMFHTSDLLAILEGLDVILHHPASSH